MRRLGLVLDDASFSEALIFVDADVLWMLVERCPLLHFLGRVQ